MKNVIRNLTYYLYIFLIVISISACSTVKETTQSTTEIENRTISIPIPDIQTESRADVYGNIDLRIIPDDVVIESQSKVIDSAGRETTIETKTFLGRKNPKTGKPEPITQSRVKQDDVKKDIPVSITKKNIIQQKEKGLIEKAFDWVKAFILWIVLVVGFISALPYLLPYLLKLLKPK